MVLGIVLSAVALVVAAVALLVNIGRLRFDRMVAREVRALYADVRPGREEIDVARAVEGLPAPAARYLLLALGESPTAVTSCRLRHGGTFRLGPDKPWLPIVGEQYYTMKSPAFVWHATARMAPLLWFEARDSYARGVGALLARVNSSFTVAEASGEDVGVSALYRWLAEAPWFPHAFVVNEGISWETVDDASARAVVRDGSARAGVVFHFSPDGLIERMTADDRTREVNGRQVPTKWSASYKDWREVEGVKVPFDCEVFWHPDEGDFCYARFVLERVEYNTPARFE